MEVIILQEKFQYLEEEICKLRQARRNHENLLNSYYTVAHKLFMHGEYLKCIKYADKAIQYGNLDSPTNALIQSYQLLSMSNKHFGRILDAMQYAFLSLKLAEQLDDKQLISFVLNNLSVIYKTMNDLDKSLEYALLSLELKDEEKAPLSYARSCGNVALIYKSQKNYEKAVQLTKKSITLFEMNGAYENTASAYCNLSVCYSEMGETQKAIDTVNKSLAMFLELDSKIGIINDYLNLSKYNIELGKFKVAEDLLNKVDREYELNDLLKAELLSLRHLLDSKTGNYESAYKNLLLYNVLKVKIDDKDSKKQIADIELGYQLKKKTREAEAYKKKNLELDRLNHELNRISSIKNKLISVIGHDLKIPLTSIIGASEMLIEYDEDLDYDQKHSFIKVVNESAGNLNSMLNNILEWSRYLDNTSKIETSELDLSELVDKIRVNLTKELEKKNIIIIIEESGFQKIKSDQNILAIVLRNFVYNAIKFSYPGSPIIVSQTSDGENMVINVIDQGIGMTQDQINCILSRRSCFSRSGTMNEKGSGSGLRICLDLLEMLNCKLEIASKEKQGSKFSIIFPA